MAVEKKTLPSTEDEWRARLSPEEFRVLRQSGTEAPFTGAYVHTTTPGIYHCKGCGTRLFSSETKFESDCGWPSFDEALPGAVRYVEDRSHGTVRTEVRCNTCDSHLGHVFEGEGYTPKNTRYCINSVALHLEPTCGRTGP